MKHDAVDTWIDGHRPRVLMAVPLYPFPVLGGLERQAHLLSVALLRQNVDVAVLSRKTRRSQPSRESVEGVPVTRMPHVASKTAAFLQSPLFVTLHLFRYANRYDVIHLHNVSWFGLWVILVAKLVRKPVLAKLPNVREWGLPALASGRLGPIKQMIFLSSDAIVAMSKESVAELSRAGYPPARTLEVTNGVEIDKSAEREPNMSGRIVVLFAGRLSPEKGVLDLLHAWQSVVCRVAGRDVVLRICGSGPQGDQISVLIAQLGLERSVEQMGHVADMPRALKNADIFVLPSYGEGNSNAILEAMAAGLPIVTTPVGGSPLLVGGAGERWLHAPGDRAGLADRLVALVNDDTARVALGEAMRARASLFDIDAVARRYLRAYQLLAQGQRHLVGSISASISHDQADADLCAD